MSQFMRERLLVEQNSELRSIVARYRGPLLEATVDLEQRLYHLITGTGGTRAATDTANTGILAHHRHTIDTLGYCYLRTASASLCHQPAALCMTRTIAHPSNGV